MIKTTTKLSETRSVDETRFIQHLNLDPDIAERDHHLLQSIMVAAIEWVEDRTNCYITGILLKLNIFGFTGKTIEIEHKGFDEVQSLKINDQIVTDYIVVRNFTGTNIILKNDIPINSDVELIYKAGYSAPAHFLQAAYIVANDFYDVERSNYSAGLVNNKTVMRLLNLE